METKQRTDHEPSQEHIEEMKRLIREENKQKMLDRGRYHRELEVGGIRECRVGTGE